MKPFSKKLLPAAGIAALGALAPPMVLAAAVDVAEVVTDIKAQLAPIGLVGGAVLLVIVASAVFRWVRTAGRIPNRKEHHGFRTVRHHRHTGGAMAHIHRLIVALAVALLGSAASLVQAQEAPQPNFSTQPYTCEVSGITHTISSAAACWSLILNPHRLI